MSKEISLAREYPNESPMTLSPVSDRGPDYPSFHYAGTKELELPDEGEMTIKFRKRSETSSTDKNGKHFYECDIEVQSICEVEGEETDDGDEENENETEAPYKSGTKDTEDALDKILATMQKMVKKDEEVHSMIESK